MAIFNEEKLESMTSLIDAKDSDVNDVLAYVAYAKETQSRASRVTTAKPLISKYFKDYNQNNFINFVLKHYISDGVSQLSTENIPMLINLKYQTLSDASHELGSMSDIRETFIGFQKHLYENEQVNY